MVSLENARFQSLAVERHKVMNNLAPKYMTEIFSTVDHKYNTRARASSNFNIPNVRTTTFGPHPMNYVGPKVWNDIPVSIRHCY